MSRLTSNTITITMIIHTAATTSTATTTARWLVAGGGLAGTGFILKHGYIITIYVQHMIPEG